MNYPNRIAMTQSFEPTESEEILYNNVSEYLRRPSLKALPSGQRKLMILVMRKLLASSTFAIAGALDTLAKRLEEQLKSQDPINIAEELALDYENYKETDDEWEEKEEKEEEPLTEEDREAIRNEIIDLKKFKNLAVSITENARGSALLNALQSAFLNAKNMGCPEKAIIFTESRKTQNYLLHLLNNAGYNNKILLFNGTNSDPLSIEIYRNWLKKYEKTDRITGSKTADMRSALVDHFRNTACIMIATEAAAEGVNLQFCSIVVNYDLPWNPQRIEQRIGRCHRYGQKHDVVVINFLNNKNAADQRVFELLDQKFLLFNGVFGSSDEVLGAIESGVEIEKRIVEIYQKCRTQEEIEEEFIRLRADLDGKINEAMKDTRRKLLEYFDVEVQDRLRVNCRDSKEYLDKHKHLLWDLTCHELKGSAEFNPNKWQFNLTKSIPGFEEYSAGLFMFGQNVEDAHRYRIGHPLAQQLIKRASLRNLPTAHLQISYSNHEQKSANLTSLVGKQGIFGCIKLVNENCDPEDHIFFCGNTHSGEILDEEQIQRMLQYPAKILKEEKIDWPRSLLEQISLKRTEVLGDLNERNAHIFQDECDKLDKWSEDQKNSLSISLEELDIEIKEIKKTIRLTKKLQDKIPLDRKLMGITLKRDQAWRRYDEEASKIRSKKEELLDKTLEKLKDQITEEKLFLVRWSLV